MQRTARGALGGSFRVLRATTEPSPYGIATVDGSVQDGDLEMFAVLKRL